MKVVPVRWIPFIILAYLLTLLQTTVGGVLAWRSASLGPIGPDLLAIVVVYVALHASSGIDAMLAGWILGLCMDLTTGGGAGGATVVGPMPIAYALGAASIYRVREAFFRDRPLPQAFLAFLLVALSHIFWVSVQAMRVGGLGGGAYGEMVLQTLLVALYTAVLTPLGCFALGRMRHWFLTPGARRSRRSR